MLGRSIARPCRRARRQRVKLCGCRLRMESACLPCVLVFAPLVRRLLAAARRHPPAAAEPAVPALVAGAGLGLRHARPRRRCRTRPCSCSTCAARWSNSAAAAGATPRSAARAAQPAQQVQLRDVLRVLDAAAKDPKISQALLLLDDFQRRGAGHAARAVRGAAALQGQRQAGGGLGLAATTSASTTWPPRASEVLLHPMGMVQIEGYGRCATTTAMRSTGWA